MSGLALRAVRPWSPTWLAGARGGAPWIRRDRTAAATGSLIGLEHEYRVLDASGTGVDFRGMLPALPVDGRPLDPADRHAIRLSWGAVLTADASEAEIALPPLATRAGTSGLAAALATRARGELAAILPPGTTLEGYSTHLSIAMPTGLADAIAPAYSRSFAPALMLLLDGRDAPGLLVRPRPGRLELGGDHREGDGLTAAIVFALGSALAAARASQSGNLDRRLPLLDIEPEPAIERYGWYVDRLASGSDLYASGRATGLRLAEGGSITAGEHLRRAWVIARRELRGRASRAELRLVDDLVAGHRPLPVELPVPEHRGATARPWIAGTAEAFRAPEGRLLDDIVRPGFILRATVATWELAVFELEGARRAVVAVPRHQLGSFLSAAATGLLDRQLDGFLARPSAGRILRSRVDALAGMQAWDGIGDPRALLAEEPDGADEPDAGGGPGNGRVAPGWRSVGTAGRAALAGARLAGIDLDAPGVGDERPGKGRARRRDSRQHDAGSREQPRAQEEAIQAAAAPAGVLARIPILVGGLATVGVAAAVAFSGVLGGGSAGPSAAPPIVAAASLGAIASATAAPGASDVAGLPPPLEEARIEGTYANGPDDSYHLTVTPACDVGPCDGTAVILSLPFEADGPRGEVPTPFARTGSGYTGTGTASVPVCRTGAGRLLSATASYTLEDFRATEQQLVDGHWLATAVAGTIVVGATEVSGDGTTCTSGSTPAIVGLRRDLPGTGPSATPGAPTPVPSPVLAEARFDGVYVAYEERFTVVATCTTGPCDADVTFRYQLDANAKASAAVISTGHLVYDGTSWTGGTTFAGLRCSNGARATVTLEFRNMAPTTQALIDGQWVATRLDGRYARLKFKQTSGPGCFGDTQVFDFSLVRRP